MAITAVNLARVSFNQRAYNLREATRLNQLGLYQTQNRISTGRRYLQPSEDPLRSAAESNLDRRMERLNEVSNNLLNVNAVLTEVESAADEAVMLFEEARSLAVQVLSDGTTPDEREALMVVVDSLLEQLVSVANRKYLNTYLFSGHQSDAPFSFDLSGVHYTGDGNRMETIVENDLTEDYFTIPGLEFFSAVSNEVRGVQDLDPLLTRDTLVSDLDGARGQGVTLGRISVTAGNTRAAIDLSSAATVGDALDLLNANLPEGLTAELGQRAIILKQVGAETIQVADVDGGLTAIDLGLAGSFDAAERAGADLNPRLSTLTPLSTLNLGAGVNLNDTFLIRNGIQSATIDLSKAETIEDVLNTINYAGVGVWARIADDGRGLEIRSRVSGLDLSIEELGGDTATNLGLRSMHGGTLLADLNGGEGVQTTTGPDVRITTASGALIDVDLDGASTLQAVIDRINAAAAGAVEADFVDTGNGLRLTDRTVGAGTMQVSPLNASPAMNGLGLDANVVGNVLAGRDVNPIRVDSAFTALMELREGMQLGDRDLMMQAGQRIERVLEQMQTVQGEMAAQARMMGERTERVESERAATEVLLSDVRDADFTEVTLEFQRLQTSLQANLTTASKLMNLSLLDFLR